MRVALVSTCSLPTPPAGYGGTELVVAELAKGLTTLGHDVTIYATGDSRPCGELRSCFPHAVWPPDELCEERHAAFAFRDLRERRVDIVHVQHAAAVPFAFAATVPCVATVHHNRNAKMLEHYGSYPEVSFVAISENQAQLSPELRFARVVHHGLDPARYEAGSGSGGYAAYLGRICSDKGTHMAMDAAWVAGFPIRLGGTAHEVDGTREYVEHEVRPRLARGGAVALGEIGHDAKVALLRDARALLFPIQWDEPFGLVMIEAMLVGTPVIATPRGSSPEIVDEGVTGFIVHSVEEMTARLRSLDGFDRARCRQVALERWSHRRMAREYAELYAALTATRTRMPASTRNGATLDVS